MAHPHVPQSAMIQALSVEQKGTPGIAMRTFRQNFCILYLMPRTLAATPPQETYMADTTKKKAPARPRKTSAKKDKAAPATKPALPPREEIERLARSYWAQRGYQDGNAEQDWLRAEQELLKMAS